MAAFVLFVLIAVTVSSPALAQEQTAPDSARQVAIPPAQADSSITMSITLPEITIEGSSTRSSSIPAAAHVTRLDSGEVAHSGAPSLADLLALRSGAFVKQYGSTGLATLSLRGMGGNQTQVLVDGLRVSNPQTGQLDLSLLPTLLIESVEVQHGAGSARHGSGSLGGTVHLHTLSAQSNPTVRAAGGGGAYGERYVSALASNGRGSWSGLLAGRYYQSNGDFPYRNSFLVPSQILRRTGAHAETTTLYGRGRWQHEAQVWTVSGWWTHARRGLPGPASARDGGAQQWDQFGRVWTEGTISVNRGTLTLSAQAQRSRLRYQNPPTQTDRTTHATTTEADAEFTHPLLGVGTLTAGSSIGYSRSSLQNGVDRLSGSTFVDATIGLSPFELQPAVRLDAIGRDGSSIVVPTPRVGIRLAPQSWSGLQIRGLVARAFRYPTFNERYYDPGGTPGLDPEDGWTVEGGASIQVSRPRTRFDADATLFATRLTDKIVWQPSYVTSGVQVWSPSNVGRVYSRGLELTLRTRRHLRPNATVSGGTVFTHTRAENRSNPDSPAYGAQLPYVPTQQWKLWGRLDWRGFSLSTSGRLVSPRYYTSDESKALPPYQIVNAQIAYEWRFETGRLSLEAQVENALDQRYEVVRLYPMPPRHATLTLRFAFGSS